MKLYFSPFSCALAVRIALYESGQSAEFRQIDLATKRAIDGSDYHDVNPKGVVPALVLADGTVLTENAAVLQYVADLAPGSGLAPPAGTIERTKLQIWLNYIAAEVHKIVYSPIFRPTYPEEARTYARSVAASRFDYLSDELRDRDYLLGTNFTVADAYLVVMLFWVEPAGLSLEPWPVLQKYRDRVRGRPAVARAVGEELSLRAA